MIPLSLHRKVPKDAKGFFVGLLPGWDAEVRPPGPLTIYTTESTENTEKRNTDRWGADRVSFIRGSECISNGVVCSEYFEEKATDISGTI